ncbi:MAG: hypothetical protein AAFR21_14890 [Pseudomonadota bacterium]
MPGSEGGEWRHLAARFAICCALLPLIAGACLLALVGAVSLPNQAIADHILTDHELFQFGRPPAFNGRKIDVGTECLGVSFALGSKPQGQSSLERAIRAPVYSSCDELLLGVEKGADLSAHDYSRYWHGYAAISRPLLTIIPYRDLRMITFNAMLLLIGAFAWRLGQDFGGKFAFAFLFPFAFINYAGFFILWTKAVSWFLAFGSALWLASSASKKFDNTRGLPVLFFFGLGCGTAFFDWLTVPLFIFALPALTYFLYRLSENLLPARTQLIDLVKLGIFFGLGYGGLWAIKFSLAAIVVGPEAWTEILQMIRFRIYGEFESVKQIPGAATAENFEALKAFWGGLTLIVFFGLALSKEDRRARLMSLFRRRPVLAVIAISPFLWWEVLSNHSQIHAIFTHTLLVLTLIPFSLVLFGEDQRVLRTSR